MARDCPGRKIASPLSASPPLCPNHYIRPINKCLSCHTGKWSCRHGNWWQGVERREASQRNNNKPNMHRCEDRTDMKAKRVKPDSPTRRQQLRQTRRQTGMMERQTKISHTGLTSLCATGPGPQVWWAKGEKVDQRARTSITVRAERGGGWRRVEGGGFRGTKGSNYTQQGIVEIIKFKCSDLRRHGVLCWQMLHYLLSHS